MFNKQLRKNIQSIDVQIGILSNELLLISDNGSNEEIIIQKIEDLTKIRCQLAESKVMGSKKEVVISGIFGIVGVLIVLDYENKEIITSKAFGMLPKVFKGV